MLEHWRVKFNWTQEKLIDLNIQGKVLKAKIKISDYIVYQVGKCLRFIELNFYHLNTSHTDNVQSLVLQDQKQLYNLFKYFKEYDEPSEYVEEDFCFETDLEESEEEISGGEGLHGQPPVIKRVKTLNKSMFSLGYDQTEEGEFNNREYGDHYADDTAEKWFKTDAPNNKVRRNSQQTSFIKTRMNTCISSLGNSLVRKPTDCDLGLPKRNSTVRKTMGCDSDLRKRNNFKRRGSEFSDLSLKESAFAYSKKNEYESMDSDPLEGNQVSSHQVSSNPGCRELPLV